jgi:hypothetical protein
MKKDELIHIWQEGNERMSREIKTDRDMITKYLNEKTLKGNRNIYFNLVFYSAIQLVNLLLLSLNLSGSLNNPSIKWIFIPQVAFTIGTLVFGIDVFNKFREINNYSESLQNLIQKQLWFYRKPYEIWLVLASLSAIILIYNFDFHLDNVEGYLPVNNKVLFAAVILGALLLTYVSQKAVSLLGMRRLKAYLYDLQQGVLEQSEKMERIRRGYLWFWVVIFILLCASLVFGILTAIK